MQQTSKEHISFSDNAILLSLLIDFQLACSGLLNKKKIKKISVDNI